MMRVRRGSQQERTSEMFVANPLERPVHAAVHTLPSIDQPMALRIEDYALIGDCETAALVGRDGSIDWLCWPRFDSGAVFAALLGNEGHGYWRIAAGDRCARISRRYRENTLVLETDIETEDGAVTLIDFMPLRRQGTSYLIRIVRGRWGRIAIHTRLAIRFDYGSIIPWVTRNAGTPFKLLPGLTWSCFARTHQ
jgi:GH15 family glucan-1,4-alpha-glucosidase